MSKDNEQEVQQDFSMKLSAIVQTMQTPNGTLAVLNEKIREVLKGTGEKTSQKAKYQLAKIGRALQREVNEFQEAYFALIKELGKEQMIDSPTEKEEVDGKQIPKKVPSGQYTVVAEGYSAFSKKVEELLDVEVCIKLRPIKLDEFGPEGLSNVSSDSLMACTDFIVD